jgi:fructokinase
MVDPNARPLVIQDRPAWLARLRRVIRRADVVKLSTDDAAYIATGLTLAIVARDILAAGPSVVLVTDGARPVAVHARGITFEIPVPEVDVVDSVGAGDAFGGAFLARWIELGLGREALATDQAALRDAVEKAVQVATLTCTRPGADPPRRADLGWATLGR